MQAVVIADDFTGAADCGSGFAAAGLRTFVVAGERAVPNDLDALAIDTDTRRMDRSSAARLARAAAERARALGARTLYKKIDSTLRGHVGAEIAATTEAWRRNGAGRPLVVLAPAFPATGRTVRGGRVLVVGTPLERTEIWRDAAQAGPADLPSMIAAAGLRPVLVELARVRAGSEALRGALGRALEHGAYVALCDAETEGDLGAIAAAGAGLGDRVIWAGSAGLARHLPAALGLTGRGAPRGESADPRPVLAIVGSRSSVAREQARVLAAGGRVAALALDPHVLLAGGGDPRWPAAAVAEALSAGDDVLLTIAESAVPRELGPALAAAVGELVAPYLGRCAGVVATGGDTARAILAAAGGSGLLVEDEVEPGAPVGLADTSAPLRFVTKAGAFGSPDTLVKCREALRGRPRRRHGKDAMARPVVGITMGDPAGVGPEVVMKALAVPEVHAICRPVVIGDAARLRLAGRLVRSGLDVRAVESPARAGEPPHVVECVDVGRVPDDLPWGRVSAAAGEAAYRCVERAVRLALEGAIAAICTAPLNKEALHAAGHRYPGHTELLAALSGTREVSMMLATPKLRVIHVTTHMGLLDAIERIEGGLVERTIVRGHEALVRAGIARPRVAVCGLNPHAGEHGLFGRGEEETKIAPGVEAARGRGIAAEGPLPADTVFFRAGRGEFDLVVAMYHDQGHGPVKVLGIEAGVNITVGLPFVRTSVDHGTAFDIAGTGRADERSMVEAIRQAVALAPKA